MAQRSFALAHPSTVRDDDRSRHIGVPFPSTNVEVGSWRRRNDKPQATPWLYANSRTAGRHVGSIRRLHAVGEHRAVKFVGFTTGIIDRDRQRGGRLHFYHFGNKPEIVSRQ